MSKLFYDEQGFFSYLQYEAISTRRRIRKRFTLPGVGNSSGTLYIYAKPFCGSQYPMQVQINDSIFELEPVYDEILGWYSIILPGGVLRAGVNNIELWSDNQAANGWAIGIESGYQSVNSHLSLDGGKTWRRERMGVTHSLSGEYMLRLRVDDPALKDPDMPSFVWEDSDCTLFSSLRDVIPMDIQCLPDPWERARALASWVSVQWSYRNEGMGIEYAPWDPLTTLSWGAADQGMLKPHPITMCVHYGVFYTSCALALGIPSRCICCKPKEMNGGGHFVSEVWIERWQKWCQVDGNCDVVFMRNGVPLSVDELSPLGSTAAEYAVLGPGSEQQLGFVKEFIRDAMLTGKVYEQWAVWNRNDFVSCPEAAPPAHGACYYSETDLVWALTSQCIENLAMFPYRVPASQLAAPPPAAWRMAACGS